MLVYNYLDFDPEDDEALNTFLEWKAAQQAECAAWDGIEERIKLLAEKKQSKARSVKAEVRSLATEISDLRKQAHDERQKQVEKLNKHHDVLARKYPDPVALERIRNEQREYIRMGGMIPKEDRLLEDKELRQLAQEWKEKQEKPPEGPDA